MGINKRGFSSQEPEPREEKEIQLCISHQSLPNTGAGKELFLWIEFSSSGVQGMGV